MHLSFECFITSASTGDGFRVYVKDALDLICSVGANPLVRLKMDGVTRETTAHLPSNHPVWNEILTMPDIVRPGAKDRRWLHFSQVISGPFGSR